MKKLTPPQVVVVHSLEVVVLSTCVAFIVQASQAFSAGTLTPQSAGAMALTAAVALGGNIGKGVLLNANTVQAAEDLFQKQPIVINNHIPAAQTLTPEQIQVPITTAANIASTPQFQQPFPTSTNTYPLAAIQVPPPAQGG